MGVLTEPIPLVQNEAGDLYIEGSRVFLEHLIESFDQGKSPEDLVRDYPSLALADIYSVIAYYLHHKEEVEAYLNRQAKKAQTTRKELKKYAPVELEARIKSKMKLDQ